MTDVLSRKQERPPLLLISIVALLLVALPSVSGFIWLRSQAVRVGRWIIVGPEAVSGPVVGAPVSYWRLPRTDMQDVFVTSVETLPGRSKPVHVGRNHRPVVQAGGFWIIER